MKRIFLIGIFFILSGIAFSADKVYMTASELSVYNGKAGMTAYVAIDGVIYDLSGVSAWKNGEHKGNKAGQDISAAILKSPHGKKVLTKRPVIGNLVAAFTLAELAAFDGQNGQPAYVAVDGIVYDETGVDAWKTGKHKGYKAGQDISAFIKKSPHGKSVLQKRTVVGKIVTDSMPDKKEVVKK